jgi:hypothetical protein
MHRVADRVTSGVRSTIAQSTEWQRIGDQIDAAFIFARADFVNVDDPNSFDIPLIESFE